MNPSVRFIRGILEKIFYILFFSFLLSSVVITKSSIFFLSILFYFSWKDSKTLFAAVPGILLFIFIQSYYFLIFLLFLILFYLLSKLSYKNKAIFSISFISIPILLDIPIEQILYGFHLKILLANSLFPILLLGWIFLTHKIEEKNHKIHLFIQNKILWLSTISLFLLIGGYCFQTICNIPILLYLLSILILYYCYSDMSDYSLVFSLLGMLYSVLFSDYFYIGFFFLILYICGKYYSYHLHLFLFIFLLFDSLFLHTFPYPNYISHIMIILISTEILYPILSYLRFVPQKKDLLTIEETQTSYFQSSIEKYVLLLTQAQELIIEPRESKQKKERILTQIMQTVCVSCKSSATCLEQKKSETYLFLTAILEKGSQVYSCSTYPIKKYVDSCYHLSTIIEKTEDLKRKYQFLPRSYFENSKITKSFSSVTSTLESYMLESKSLEMIPNSFFVSFFSRLYSSGYSISFYKIISPSKEYFCLYLCVLSTTQEIIEREILPIAESVFRLNLEIVDFQFSTDSSCYFYISLKSLIQFQYGKSSLSKKTFSTSGDSLYTKILPNNTKVFALSDGMGSGYSAYLESQTLLSHLDILLQIDTSSNTLISLLNNLYSLKPSFDSFATMDIIFSYPQETKLRLYKLGGSSSYYYHNHCLNEIKNTLPPVGISQEIQEIELFPDENDLLILASDGIGDYLPLEDLNSLLQYDIHKSPQEISNDILQYILSSFPVRKDDLSVLVIRICNEIPKKNKR